MAKTTLNSALKTIQGGIDNWVYRNHHGQVVISPRVSPTDRNTPAQQAVREQFRLAASYARAAAANPAARAIYWKEAKARGVPVYAVIVTDFLKPPTVDLVDLAGYHGAVGDPISVRASDDMEVTAVSVAIRAADLTVLEEGAATLTDGAWVYRAKTARTSGQAVTITATAVDRPGHTGTKTETWTMA